VGVSFIGIFIIVYNIFFWICGLASSLAWDYAPGVPQGEEAQMRVPWREKPIGTLVYRYLLGNPPLWPSGVDVPENIEKGEKSTSIQVSASSQPDNGSTALPAPTRLNPRLRQLVQTLSLAFAPINLVIAGSLCIALIQPLKALFVDVSSEGGPSWKGPDGRPPLAFLMDTGSYSLPSRSHLTISSNSRVHRFHHDPTIPCAPGFLLREDENPPTDLPFANSRDRLGLYRQVGTLAHHRCLHRAGNG
jgi:auxin efflux carrier family protein